MSDSLSNDTYLTLRRQILEQRANTSTDKLGGEALHASFGTLLSRCHTSAMSAPTSKDPEPAEKYRSPLACRSGCWHLALLAPIPGPRAHSLQKHSSTRARRITRGGLPTIFYFLGKCFGFGKISSIINTWVYQQIVSSCGTECSLPVRRSSEDPPPQREAVFLSNYTAFRV